MARMGHDSMQAAIIYQYASREADKSIAAHLNAQLEGLDSGAKKKTKKKGAEATKSKVKRVMEGKPVAGDQPAPGRDGIPGGAENPEDRDGEDGAAAVG
jgi:hypothetical protein